MGRVWSGSGGAEGVGVLLVPKDWAATLHVLSRVVNAVDNFSNRSVRV